MRPRLAPPATHALATRVLATPLLLVATHVLATRVLATLVFATPLLFATVACSGPAAGTPTVPISSVSASPDPDPPESAQPVTSSRPRVHHEPDPDTIGGGCEAVKAAYLQRCRDNPGTCARDPEKDIGAGVYGSVLNRGSYLNTCGVPSTMEVSICTAVQNGQAIGVTVVTRPHDSAIGQCVAAAVRRLGFPSSPRLDITRTTFAAQ